MDPVEAMIRNHLDEGASDHIGSRELSERIREQAEAIAAGVQADDTRAIRESLQAALLDILHLCRTTGGNTLERSVLASLGLRVEGAAGRTPPAMVGQGARRAA